MGLRMINTGMLVWCGLAHAAEPSLCCLTQQNRATKMWMHGCLEIALLHAAHLLRFFRFQSQRPAQQHDEQVSMCCGAG